MPVYLLGDVTGQVYVDLDFPDGIENRVKSVPSTERVASNDLQPALNKVIYDLNTIQIRAERQMAEEIVLKYAEGVALGTIIFQCVAREKFFDASLNALAESINRKSEVAPIAVLPNYIPPVIKIQAIPEEDIEGENAMLIFATRLMNFGLTTETILGEVDQYLQTLTTMGPLETPPLTVSPPTLADEKMLYEAIMQIQENSFDEYGVQIVISVPANLQSAELNQAQSPTLLADPITADEETQTQPPFIFPPDIFDELGQEPESDRRRCTQNVGSVLDEATGLTYFFSNGCMREDIVRAIASNDYGFLASMRLVE